MVFELGRYYKHNGGSMLHTIALAETTMYGEGLIAEEAGEPNLIVVGQDETHAVNYVEIDKKEWNKYYGIEKNEERTIVDINYDDIIDNRFEILDL